MTEPKWSQGKWEKQPGIPYVNCGDAGPCFGPVVMAGTEEEMQADACVMAAARDLFIALQSCVWAWEGKSGMGTMYEMPRAISYAREMLSKARGEQ